MVKTRQLEGALAKTAVKEAVVSVQLEETHAHL
jgi:hypothetical protein